MQAIENALIKSMVLESATCDLIHMGKLPGLSKFTVLQSKMGVRVEPILGKLCFLFSNNIKIIKIVTVYSNWNNNKTFFFIARTKCNSG